MTDPIDSNAVREHNRRQRAYFEGTEKKTMAPRDTPYLRRHVDEALRSAGCAPGQRVLEVGCGMGRYTLILAARSMTVEGLDLSPVLLERLQESAAGRYDIPLHCADLAAPPETLLGAFDVVLGFFVLHHLHQLQPCLEAAVRLARPGGMLVFLEPNAYNPLYYVQMAVTPGMTWGGDGGIVRMRPGVVLPAMAAAGLRQVTVRRFGFFPPFLANHPAGRRAESLLEAFPLWRPLLPFQIFSGQRPL